VEAVGSIRPPLRNIGDLRAATTAEAIVYFC
jgi:hypothetical protein